MQRIRGLLLPIFAAVLLLAATLVSPPTVLGATIPAPPVDPIRIGIGRSLTTASVWAPGGINVVAGGAVQLQAKAGELVRLNLVGDKVQVVGVTQTFTSVRLVPVGMSSADATAGGTVPPAPSNPITYRLANGTDKKYRGEIEVVVTSVQELSVVNVVNLEEYLLGVVPREMPALWPIEAVKAQAVAARNYALRNIGTYDFEGFDMTDDPYSQVYGGLAAEYPNSSNAVVQTRGKVLYFGTNLAATYYHSSSGGKTENNEIIWFGTPIDYLRGVDDYDGDSPYYSWEVPYTLDEFEAGLKSVGRDVGHVTGISPSGTKGYSGRWSAWKVTGTTGTQTLGAELFRQAMGTLSSPKAVQFLPPVVAEETYTASDSVSVISAAGTATRAVSGTNMISGSGAVVTASSATVVTAKGTASPEPGGVTVIGGGYGHGIGMSQYGAEGAAILGMRYDQILTHYYQGTQVGIRKQ